MIKFKLENPRYKKDWWYRTASGDFKPFTKEDLLRWLENTKDVLDKIIITLLYFTGARPSEISMLKWSDIKLKEEKISITLYTLKLRAMKQRTIWIPLNEITEVLIKEKMKHVDDELVLKGLKQHNIRYRVYRMTKNEICPYFLRHNFYSKLAVQGIPITILKEHKGSATIDSVEPYLHVSSEEMVKLANKIE